MMDDEHTKLLGELKAHSEHTREGISRIESTLSTFSQNMREDIIKLHEKGDKAHKRADEIAGDLKSHKAKINGFVAAISAIWALIMAWLGQD